MTSTINKSNRSLLSSWNNADSLKIEENLHYGAMLTWSETNFSAYAFDLVALLNGSYEIGRLSSFHALGTTKH